MRAEISICVKQEQRKYYNVKMNNELAMHKRERDNLVKPSIDFTKVEPITSATIATNKNRYLISISHLRQINFHMSILSRKSILYFDIS